MSGAAGIDDVRSALQASVGRVREDREHGASWLAGEVTRALLQATSTKIADAEEHMNTIRAAARAFVAARPSMAAVANAAAAVWAASAPATDQASQRPRSARASIERMRVTALDIMDAAQENSAAIQATVLPLLTGTLFTLSRSATVERALLALGRSALPGVRRAIVCESRPGGEGIATARVLAAAGWEVTLVPDAACGVFIGEAAVVICGADSVRADGSVVNKVGTYPLALLARGVGVPVYAVCESLKIAAPEFPLVLEEMAPDELLPEPIPGVIPRNVYFDRTSAELITGVVTERGLLAHADITHRAAEAGAALTYLAADEQVVR